MASNSFIQRKVTKAATLNLTSLMDIFTILVFFLLMNTGESQELAKANFVKLPDSNADGALHGQLVINVAQDKIVIDNKEIVAVSDVNRRPGEVNKPLGEALKAFAEESGELTEVEKKIGRSVTIMGDQGVPYDLLKAVMTTCSAYGFRDVSLAVNQVAASALTGGGQ
ncbi:ExbD/TolR family protein [Thalassolituus hydrocarboniclasticus]|uniref:Biopolymer transporter ExbD n=1 Tax=Thalassolituus hydrocarboniclasticus TaxID=2742796 RepID=A0ABY6A654_9GAMM|nr:biopolymer transporter ExbD [Thalassolituus hydrocarboniclasticus]UXD86353.1 biopolymer transporter ExbD [Thalassolituus hydrocarboniclasticus]